MTMAQDCGKVVNLMHRPPLLPKKYTWYSFLLEADSTPGPWCDQKDYVTEKFHWHHGERNPRPDGLWCSALITTPPRDFTNNIENTNNKSRRSDWAKGHDKCDIYVTADEILECATSDTQALVTSTSWHSLQNCSRDSSGGRPLHSNYQHNRRC